jgi:hypothetical protein
VKKKPLKINDDSDNTGALVCLEREKGKVIK